jgi:gliding motility-associated-like protein
MGVGNNLNLSAPEVTTTYLVRFESGCDTTSAQQVTVVAVDLPQPVFVELTDRACVNGPLYRYVVDGFDGSSFTWNITGGTIEDDLGDTVYVNWGEESGNGILEVTETSSLGCVSLPVSVAVEISGPTVDLEEGIILCAGTTVTVTPDGDFVSYRWHDGSTDPDFTADQEGWVRVEVTDESGCSASDSVYITEVALPVVDLGPDTMVCTDQGIILDAGSDGVQYRWSTGDITQQITLFDEGEREIWTEVENQYGCTGGDTVLIRECDIGHEIDIPTGITPNEDGVNDVWNIRSLGEFNRAIVEVFDQWGTLVWKSEPGYPEPWDGRNMRDKLVPADSYHFVINFNNGSDDRHVGYITVIR